MTHNTAHHVQEADHAHHHAADPFDKRVAMSMSIIAAALAFVGMLSHRAHNHVLLHQSEATAKFVEATAKFVEGTDHFIEASNTWSQYQSKRIRGAMFESNVELIGILGTEESKDRATKQVEKLRPKIKEYEGTEDPDSLPNLKKKAEGFTSEREAALKESKVLLKERDEALKESKHVHRQADFLDGGHLGIELALVLCSVAVLTKQRSFWFVGVLIGIVGFAIAMYSFLIH